MRGRCFSSTSRQPRLALELGPAPESIEWSPELASWFERYEAAVAELEAHEADSHTLRVAVGPIWDSEYPEPLDRALLVSAALGTERREGRLAGLRGGR